jgi:3D (Asp-Asp-Asp) domain-containing protein
MERNLFIIAIFLMAFSVLAIMMAEFYDECKDEKKTPTPKPTQTAKPTPDVLRTIVCELTYYCCEEITGNKKGTTASGVKLTDGQEPERNIVACNWLPFGSKLDIDGVIYYVEDRGGRELSRFGRLDIYDPRGPVQCGINGRKKNVKVKLLHK